MCFSYTFSGPARLDDLFLSDCTTLKQESSTVLLFSHSIRTVWGNGERRNLNDKSKPHHHLSWRVGSHLLGYCVCVCAQHSSFCGQAAEHKVS